MTPLSRTPRSLASLRDAWVAFPSGLTLRPGFDRIGGEDLRIEYRLPGQGVGREVIRTTEEGTALDRSQTRIRQILGAGGRVLRVWVLPDEPAASAKEERA